jgi:hypothetical protein
MFLAMPTNYTFSITILGVHIMNRLFLPRYGFSPCLMPFVAASMLVALAPLFYAVAQPVTRPPQAVLRFVSQPPSVAYLGLAYTYQALAVYGSSRDVTILPFPLPGSNANVRAQISYSLDAAPQGMTIESTSGIVRWTPPAASSTGAVAVTIRATATLTPTTSGTISQTSATQTFRIQVQSLDNISIMFASQAPNEAITGVEYQYRPFAVYGTRSGDSSRQIPLQGANQDAIRYELVSGPQGMTFDATRNVIRWTPAATTPAGSVAFTVRASLIAQTSISTTQTFTVRVVSREQVAVRFVSAPPREATVGREYVYNARAFYNLALFGVNPLPTLSNLPFPNVTNATRDLGNVIGGLLTPRNLTYNIVSGPQGMTIDATTGTVRWTPRDTATAQVSIRAAVSTNATLSSTQTFTIRVAQGPCATFAGRVRFTDGSAVIAGTVTLQATTNGTVTQPSGANVNSAVTYSTAIQNGSYRLTVRPGSYFMSVAGNDFVTQYAINVPSPDRATRFEVKCGDSLVRDFVVERRPTPRFYLVSGKVTRQSDAAPVRATVEFVQTPSTANTRPSSRVFSATTDQNGNYALALSNEFTYTVRAVPAQSSGLATLYYNGTANGTTNATGATTLTVAGDVTLNFALPQARQFVAQAADGESATIGNNGDVVPNNRTETLFVAPNPVSNEAVVKLPSFRGKARLFVANTLGVTLLTLDTNSAESSIPLNVGTFPPGTYTVRLVGDDVNATARIFITR